MNAPLGISVPRPVWLASLVLGAVLAGILVFHALTDAGGPLEPSGPEETVLRVLRLAGMERAAIGVADDTAVLRLDVPTIISPPDVEIAWQTGLAALAEVYPDAEWYTMQLFTDAAPLVELRAAGTDVRAAVDADDPAALRAAIDPRYIARSGEETGPAEASEDVARVVPEPELAVAQSLLGATPEGAMPLPAGAVATDVHLAGGYLDAKNRAAGLLGDEGPSGTAVALSRAAAAARRSAPPVAAPAPGESVVARYIERLGAAIGAPAAGGTDGLRAEAEALAGRGDRDAIARLRALVICAEALDGGGGAAGMVRGSAELTRQVAAAPLEPGAMSDAVLAAADTDDAPRDAVDVRAFERTPERDVGSGVSAGGTELPAVVLRLHARTGTPPVLGWATPAGGQTAAPGSWQAFRRADGSMYWLAGDDGIAALTDASVLGWAFSARRAAVVDAARCGRVQAFFAAE